jgi:hypothetical protein
MSVAAERYDDLATVEVAETVVSRMEQLPAHQAEAVARAIARVPTDPGVPIRIDVPGGPPGPNYKALAPEDPDAPIVIYHQERTRGNWLVVALLDRDKYQEYRQAEKTNLFDDPAFQTLMTAGLIAAGVYLIVRAGSKP